MPRGPAIRGAAAGPACSSVVMLGYLRGLCDLRWRKRSSPRFVAPADNGLLLHLRRRATTRQPAGLRAPRQIRHNFGKRVAFGPWAVLLPPKMRMDGHRL